MERISKHISYNEAIHSDTAKRLGILNIPDKEQLSRMKLLAEKVFEPLRERFGVPIYISSFFRCAALNKAIKGSVTSQHVTGEAVDIDADIYGKVTNKELFDYIKDNLDFDQLILENVGSDGTGGWVHVSYISSNKNRKKILIMKIVNGKQRFEKYK